VVIWIVSSLLGSEPLPLEVRCEGSRIPDRTGPYAPTRRRIILEIEADSREEPGNILNCPREQFRGAVIPANLRLIRIREGEPDLTTPTSVYRWSWVQTSEPP